MKSFSKILILLMVVLSIQQSYSQEKNKGSFDLGMDLVSRYTWRGIDYGEDPSVQPYLSYSIGGFEIGYWGAYAFNYEGFQETDLYLSYTFLNEKLTVGLIDYFYPDIVKGHILGQDYFDFGSETTAHTLEASLSFNGTESFPLSIAIYSCIYGADEIFSDSVLDATTNTYTYNYEDNFSTYIELGYSFSTKDVDFDLFAGYLLNGVDQEDALWALGNIEGFYGDGPGFINLGAKATKTVKVTEYLDLPISTSLIFNPKRERIFFIFGVSF
jgi:hypothetical protein